MIGDKDETSHEFRRGEWFVVIWTFGHEYEDGPFTEGVYLGNFSVRLGVERVITERNRELEVSQRAE
jgi:hypothetical protein